MGMNTSILLHDYDADLTKKQGTEKKQKHLFMR